MDLLGIRITIINHLSEYDNEILRSTGLIIKYLLIAIGWKQVTSVYSLPSNINTYRVARIVYIDCFE